MRYYYAPLRMAKIKKIVTTLNAGKDLKKLSHSYIVGRNVIVWQFLIKIKYVITK